MNIWTKILISLSMYMLFSAVSTASFAAVLTLASSGNGVYALQGFGLSDVGGLDITISYDTSTLANPRVVQGALLSGGMMAVNGNSPGTIRMAGATSRSISGGGNLATVSFDLRGAGSGKVLSMSASLINSNGAKLPVQSLVQNPSDDSSTTNKNDSTQTNGTTTTQTTDTTQTVTTENTTSGGTIGPRYINAPGTVTLPAEKVDALKEKGGATESNELSPIDVRGGGRSANPGSGTEPQSNRPGRGCNGKQADRI
jgi:hypothetical protein